MSDIATISAFLTSVKNATDIAKLLRGLDASVAQADLKLKIAELIEALADAKISAAELQDLLAKKDQELVRLTEALSVKADVVKDGDAYFAKSPDGKAEGEPFCVHCWENDHALRHLVRAPQAKSLCPSCKTTYEYLCIPVHKKNG